MKKVNVDKSRQIVGGRWKCTVCDNRKFLFHNAAKYHQMCTGHKIKWCW